MEKGQEAITKIMREKAYEAFWWLNDNHHWAIQSLEVLLMKVNPETGSQDEDSSKNVKIEYWIEGGPFEGGHCTHDSDLDCGGDSFDEAIIKYASLIKKKYGGSKAK